MVQSTTQREFLENHPPNSKCAITDFPRRKGFKELNEYMHLPEIVLHCYKCNGQRAFATCPDTIEIIETLPVYEFVQYSCKNCSHGYKTFAYHATFDAQAKTWMAVKYGEDPLFGPPVPSRAISLIGPDRDLFLKGRQCENQGLGVGAFVYYRRVIENQKNRIFDEFIRVSKHLSADPLLLAELETAKSETQFTKAVDAIKHGLPQSLLINGQNPLTLLHSALSQGLHDESDSECLENAADVRVVLFELAERLAQAMKEEAELTSAVSRLLNRRQKQSTEKHRPREESGRSPTG